MSHVSKSKATRLDLRLSEEIKQTIEQAASMIGVTVSHFVLSATVNRAHEVIRESTDIRLSDRDRDRFLAALDRDDDRPNEPLKLAAERYHGMSKLSIRSS